MKQQKINSRRREKKEREKGFLVVKREDVQQNQEERK
jgi:hypothetical protein